LPYRDDLVAPTVVIKKMPQLSCAAVGLGTGLLPEKVRGVTVDARDARGSPVAKLVFEDYITATSWCRRDLNKIEGRSP